MSYFREISPAELNESPFKTIGDDWILITAPDETKESGANAMTASWGGLGVLWSKPVATIYVRPQRYTFELCEKSERISLCVLPEEYRPALKICGTKSGKDTDKLKECSLTATEFDGERPFISYYAEIVRRYKQISPDAKFFFVTFPNAFSAEAERLSESLALLFSFPSGEA